MHVATTKCVPYLEDGKVNSQSAVSQSVSPSLRRERRRKGEEDEMTPPRRRQKRHPLSLSPSLSLSFSPNAAAIAAAAVSLLFLPYCDRPSDTALPDAGTLPGGWSSRRKI